MSDYVSYVITSNALMRWRCLSCTRTTPPVVIYQVNESTVRILTFHSTQAHYSNILKINCSFVFYCILNEEAIYHKQSFWIIKCYCSIIINDWCRWNNHHTHVHCLLILEYVLISDCIMYIGTDITVIYIHWCDVI